METDYYKVLQVDPLAEPEIIEVVYKRLVRKYHPDINRATDANRRMQEINLAYEVLSDPQKRAEYDYLMRRRMAPSPARSRRRYSRPSPGKGSSRRKGHQEELKNRPRLMVSPNSFEFGSVTKGSIHATSLRIGVTHGRTMNGKVLANQGWIKIGSSQSFDHSSAIVQIIVDTTSLRDGMRHEGTVTVKSLAYGTLAVPISVHVAAEPRPALKVEPASLDFGTMRPGQLPKMSNLSLIHEGTDPLSGSFNVRSSWLNVSQLDFQDTVTVQVIADVARLKPGRSYVGRIEVHSNKGIITVQARVQVAREMQPFPPPDSDDYWPVLISRLSPANKWEKDFLATVTLQARQRGWRPSPGQEAVIERIRRRGSK